MLGTAHVQMCILVDAMMKCSLINQYFILHSKLIQFFCCLQNPDDNLGITLDWLLDDEDRKIAALLPLLL